MANEKAKKESFTERKENDWGGFGKSVLKSFVITLIWALVGCNFLFLQNYVVKGEQYLGNLFPSDSTKAPYWDMNKVPRSKMLGGGLVQTAGSDMNKKQEMITKITGLNRYSAPYTLKSNPPGLWGDFLEWIARSIEFSYVNGRGLISRIFEIFSLGGDSLSSSLMLWLSTPFLFLMIFLTPGFGFFSTLLGELQAPNKGWLFTIIFAFILGFSFILPGTVATVQTVQIILTFLLLPLVLNGSEVFKLMGNHYSLYTGMFGLLVLSNSFNYLKLEAVIVMILTYIYLVWKNFGK